MATKLTLSEKVRKLEEAGIDTSKWAFQFEVNGVTLNLDEHEEIKELVGDKFLFSPVDFDKEILTETLRMINSKDGFDELIRNHFSYEYQFDWLLSQLKKMKHMSEKDRETYERFITKDVVFELLEHRLLNVNKDEIDYPQYFLDVQTYLRNRRNDDDLINVIESYTQILAKTKDGKYVYPTTDFYTKKCNALLDAYKGLRGFACLNVLAKNYGIGNLEDLYKQLDEFTEQKCLWKFIRILLNMDLTEVYNG